MIFEFLIVSLVALTLGSFGNNVISYYSQSSPFDLFRSKCPCCKKELTFSELIPVFSFILQKGRCSECSFRISIRYLFVELSTLGIGLFVYGLLGFEFSTHLVFLILYVLLLISVIDYYSLIIPNLLVFVLLLLTGYLLIIKTENLLDSIAVSMLIGFILSALQLFYKNSKNKIVLGYGDIKLVFVLSLLLNLVDNLLAIWFSSLIALIAVISINIKNLNELKEIKIPFGLYLSIGFAVMILWNLKSDNKGLESLITLLWPLN